MVYLFVAGIVTFFFKAMRGSLVTDDCGDPFFSYNFEGKSLRHVIDSVMN